MRRRRRVTLASVDAHLLELIDLLRTAAGQLQQPASKNTEAVKAPVKRAAGGEVEFGARFAAAVDALPPRLRGVFELIGEGQSTAQIAALNCKSPRTIETYRYHLRRRLGLKDPQILAQQAWQYVQAFAAKPLRLAM